MTNNSLAANQRPNISLIDRRLCDARRVPYRVRFNGKKTCWAKKQGASSPLDTGKSYQRTTVIQIDADPSQTALLFSSLSGQRKPEKLLARTAGRSERAAESDAPSRFAPAPQPEKKLGTGHGRNQSAPGTYTSFERARPGPQEVITIFYDTHQNLVALGVVRVPRAAAPEPFPGQFVPDPR